jgi:hypothetical protein
VELFRVWKGSIMTKWKGKNITFANETWNFILTPKVPRSNKEPMLEGCK